MKKFFLITFFWVLGVSTGLAQNGQENLRFFPEFKYRLEFPDLAQGTLVNQEFHRVLFKLGARYPIKDKTKLEFRLATGNGRTSVFHNLGDSDLGNDFGNWSLKLDRAFLNYGYHELSSLKMDYVLGRAPNVSYVPKGSDLQWDSDLNFDGTSLQFGFPDASLRLTSGAYILKQDLAVKDSRSELIVASIDYSKVEDDWEVSVGVGTNTYRGLQGRGPVGQKSGGNTVENSVYKYAYKPVNIGGDFALKSLGFPVLIFSEFVVNTAINDENLAYIAGIRIGDSKKVDSWFVSYDYRSLEKDSLIGALTDGDSLVGYGTDGNSHRVRVGYQPELGFQVSLSYFIGKAAVSSGAYRRNKGQLDLGFSF